MHDKCMAVKTITIDIEAYEVLARLKRKGQSFSQVIKERLGGRTTGNDLLIALGQVDVAADTVASLERQIKSRKRSVARAPRL